MAAEVIHRLGWPQDEMVRKAHDPAMARRYAELGQQWRQLANQIEGKANQDATVACEIEPGLTGPVAARVGPPLGLTLFFNASPS